MELTIEDYITLIEAMDSWIDKGLAGKVMADVVGMMLAKNSEEDRAEQKRMREQTSKEFAMERDHRLERARVIQAKLIMKKDQLIAEQLAKG